MDQFQKCSDLEHLLLKQQDTETKSIPLDSTEAKQQWQQEQLLQFTQGRQERIQSFKRWRQDIFVQHLHQIVDSNHSTLNINDNKHNTDKHWKYSNQQVDRRVEGMIKR